MDAALRRIREGGNPRVLILDLSDSTAPIAELSAARSVGGGDLKILALGTVNPHEVDDVVGDKVSSGSHSGASTRRIRPRFGLV